MKQFAILSVGAVVLAALGGVGMACSSDDEPVADAGVLVPETGPSSSSGTASCPQETVDPSCNYEKCSTELGGPSICVAGACKRIDLGDDCKQADIFGAYKDDRAIWIGGAMAMIQANGKINTSGPPRRNSIEFAVEEINGQGGVPSVDPACNNPRPLAAVVCDDGGGRNTSGTTDVTERIGNHLVNDLGIKAIIGGGTSNPTIALAQKSTIPGGALIIAPSATAIAITALEGANLPTGERVVWRTAPSDLLQSQALLKLYDGVVAKLSGTTKLAIVDKGDAYGKGLGDAVQAGAMLNGAAIPPGNTELGDGGVGTASFYRGQCAGGVVGDGGAQPCAAQLEALEQLAPNIVILPGTGEAITNVMIPYEATNPTTRPFYLLPDGPAKTELWNAVKADAARGGDLVKRIQGTVPGAVTALAKNFFDLSYKLRFPNVPNEDGAMVESTLLFGMAGCYDATYLLTYAMVANRSDARTFSGAQLAQGFAKTIGGALTNVGTADFSSAVGTLRAGSSVDFNGASGPLDFDTATGTAPSDMIVWCVRKNPNSASGDYQRFDDTGLTFDSRTGSLLGTYTCPE